MPDAREGIEADIERLETGIRQLKIQYDMFFAGAVPREPVELRSEVERMLRRYSNAPIRKYAHRFHLNSLAGRFNALSELWTKTLRALEEGNRQAGIPSQARPETPDEQVLAKCRLHDPIEEQEVLKILHARYLAAREKAGGELGRISFESFLRSVSSQAERLRETSGCDLVELRVVLHDGKVLLKARPGRV